MKRAVILAPCARLAVACAIAIPMIGGCTGSETGNPSATANLRLAVRATDPSIATVGETGDAIRVEELWLSVTRIAAVPCAAGAEEVAINQEPIGDNLVPGLDAGKLPVGEYCGLRMMLAPTTLSTLPTGVTTGPASVAVYGTRSDDVPFAVLSAAPLDLFIPGAAFTISDGHSLLLAFDVSAWLRDAVLDSAAVVDGLAVLDGREHPSLTATFEAQLTATLHDDLNLDGHVDADEGTLATIH
jgi:hypothetical protein